jgi:hypothetical protein
MSDLFILPSVLSMGRGVAAGLVEPAQFEEWNLKEKCFAFN